MEPKQDARAARLDVRCRVQDVSEDMVQARAPKSIIVPAVLAATAIDDLLLASVRLDRALRGFGCARLGDLDGHTYAELQRQSNCGRVTIAELKRLLDDCGAPGTGVPSEPRFAIPLHLRNVSIHDLPFTRRVKNCLARQGTTTIGALDGVTHRALLARRGAGALFFRELETVLATVTAMDPTQAPGATCATLCVAIDVALQRLPVHERQLLKLIYGARGEPQGVRATLSPCGLGTHQRASVVHQDAIDRLRGALGPFAIATIRGLLVARAARGSVGAGWFARAVGTRGRRGAPLSFYRRLVEAMAERLCAASEERAPCRAADSSLDGVRRHPSLPRTDGPSIRRSARTGRRAQ